MRFELRALASLACALSACGPCVPPKKFYDEELYEARREWLDERQRKPPEARPRCEASDPSCGPDPNGLYEGCYDPSGGRTPAWEEALAQPPNCKHDGECIDTGCGKTCSHYRALHEKSLRWPEEVSTCELPEEFARNDLLCGCVENRCMFFTQ